MRNISTLKLPAYSEVLLLLLLFLLIHSHYTMARLMVTRHIMKFSQII